MPRETHQERTFIVHCAFLPCYHAQVVDKHLPDGSVVYEECDKAGTGWRSSSALNSGKGASPAKPAIASAKPKPKPAVVRPPPKVKALHPPAGG